MLCIERNKYHLRLCLNRKFLKDILLCNHKKILIYSPWLNFNLSIIQKLHAVFSKHQLINFFLITTSRMKRDGGRSGWMNKQGEGNYIFFHFTESFLILELISHFKVHLKSSRTKTIYKYRSLNIWKQDLFALYMEAFIQ